MVFFNPYGAPQPKGNEKMDFASWIKEFEKRVAYNYGQKDYKLPAGVVEKATLWHGGWDPVEAADCAVPFIPSPGGPENTL